MSKKIKILHITPHLGAGVGTVVLNYLLEVKDDPIFNHDIVCLDYANERALELSKKYNFSLIGDMAKKKSELLKLINKTDIVFIHWWNHPLLYDFLIREKLPASRIIIWSHILGSLPPNNLTRKTLDYADIFVFTSPLSYNLKEIKELPEERKKYVRDVWSTGGLDRIKSIKPKKHNGFNIGYIGNVDYAKMHPDFLDICNQVNIPDVKFIIVGGPNGKQMQEEAKKRGMGEKFNFTGFVSEEEKWEYLSTFDIFGYPLARHHYGTCDQVLQESMAVGIVPVVLNNPMESYMVKNNEVGIIAKDEEEYVKALENLYHHPKLRDSLSKNAKKYAYDVFSLENMIKKWNNLFNETLAFPKKIRKWKIDIASKKISAKDIFLESLDHYGEAFILYCQAEQDKDKNKKEEAVKKIKKMAESANWCSKTKSTVHQYYSFFPDDKHLAVWSQLMVGPVKK